MKVSDLPPEMKQFLNSSPPSILGVPKKERRDSSASERSVTASTQQTVPS